jgi:hypothetical protein
MDKTPLWPHSCSDCKCKFYSDKLPEGAMEEDMLYKVGRKNLVYYCENAANTCHRCVFALCLPCKVKREQEQELNYGSCIKRGASGDDENCHRFKRIRKERAIHDD